MENRAAARPSFQPEALRLFDCHDHHLIGKLAIGGCVPATLQIGIDLIQIDSRYSENHEFITRPKISYRTRGLSIGNEYSANAGGKRFVAVIRVYFVDVHVRLKPVSAVVVIRLQGLSRPAQLHFEQYIIETNHLRRERHRTS